MQRQIAVDCTLAVLRELVVRRTLAGRRVVVALHGTLAFAGMPMRLGNRELVPRLVHAGQRLLARKCRLTGKRSLLRQRGLERHELAQPGLDLPQFARDLWLLGLELELCGNTRCTLERRMPQMKRTQGQRVIQQG